MSAYKIGYSFDRSECIRAKQIQLTMLTAIILYLIMFNLILNIIHFEGKLYCTDQNEIFSAVIKST